MSALSKARPTRERATVTARRLPVAAAVIVYGGGMVALSGAGAAAVAKPASADNTLKIVGVAEDTADNRTGAAAALSVDVKRGCFLLDNDAVDPVALGDIGATVYAVDDHTIAKTNGAGARPAAGTLFDIDAAGGVWVEFK